MNTVRPVGAFAAEGLRVGAVLAAVGGALLYTFAWVHPAWGSCWSDGLLWLYVILTTAPPALALGIAQGLLVRAAWSQRRRLIPDLAPTALAGAAFTVGLGLYGAWLWWGTQWDITCSCGQVMGPEPRIAWLPVGLALTLGSMLHVPLFGVLHLTARAPEDVAEARRMHLPVAAAATAGMFAIGWALIELGWAPVLE